MFRAGSIDQEQSASLLHREQADADIQGASIPDAEAGLWSVSDAAAQPQSDTHQNAQVQKQTPSEATTPQQQQQQHQQQQQQQQQHEVTSTVIDRTGHNTDYANAQVLKLCAIESWPWQTGSSKHIKQFFQVR